MARRTRPVPSGERPLLLGLDVGTTATKAVAFDLHGNVVAAASQATDLIIPRPGWVEQDPEALWKAVVTTLRAVLAQAAPGDRIVALSMGSQGGTTIPVDAAGVPTTHAISWMDARGPQQAAAVRAALGDEFVQSTTGWPLGNGLPLQHIGWLRDTQPAVAARTAHYLFVNDFVVRRLTGSAVMNPSDATMTQLFDIAQVDWAPRLLAAVGTERQQLSPVRPSGQPLGELTPEASRITGLPVDTLVVNGAHDQYCAAVGTGVTRPGTTLLSCGTAWVILAVPSSLETGLESGLAVSCHAVPGRWGAIRSLGGVGASLEWFLKQVWHNRDDEPRAAGYASLNAAVARTPAGARELLFYPLTGGHGRIGSGLGGFAHLTLAHTREDMARAVMEGICFELRWALDEITAHGVPVDSLTMVGGAAESPVWPQIVADVTALSVTVPADRQATARGAAILAGVGAGIFPDLEAGFLAFRGEETHVQPDAAHRYEAPFARYRHYAQALTHPHDQPREES